MFSLDILCTYKKLPTFIDNAFFIYTKSRKKVLHRKNFLYDTDCTKINRIVQYEKFSNIYICDIWQNVCFV